MPEFIGYYTSIVTELSFWIGLSCVWEWQTNRSEISTWTSYAFVLTDVTFVAAIPQTRRAVDISPVVAYVLIVLTAGLPLNRRLIYPVGLSGIAGYLFCSNKVLISKDGMFHAYRSFYLPAAPW